MTLGLFDPVSAVALLRVRCAAELRELRGDVFAGLRRLNLEFSIVGSLSPGRYRFEWEGGGFTEETVYVDNLGNRYIDGWDPHELAVDWFCVVSAERIDA